MVVLLLLRRILGTWNGDTKLWWYWILWLTQRKKIVLLLASYVLRRGKWTMPQPNDTFHGKRGISILLGWMESFCVFQMKSQSFFLDIFTIFNQLYNFHCLLLPSPNVSRAFQFRSCKKLLGLLMPSLRKRTNFPFNPILDKLDSVTEIISLCWWWYNFKISQNDQIFATNKTQKWKACPETLKWQSDRWRKICVAKEKEQKWHICMLYSLCLCFDCYLFQKHYYIIFNSSQDWSHHTEESNK
jgi:hypothetical protein